MIASKTWVRKKEGEGDAAGGEGAGDTGEGEAHGE
jgi:hypothetical protein